MAEYYHDQWLKARLTEGASQRVQEDTLKFARIMEGLGTGLLDSIMTLIAFTPILWVLSKQVNVLPLNFLFFVQVVRTTMDDAEIVLIQTYLDELLARCRLSLLVHESIGGLVKEGCSHLSSRKFSSVTEKRW